jgi:glycosyltransferase involved in cell wall biosynthesis
MASKNKVSVVTITKNNLSGLHNTLLSISQLNIKPFEVLVIDGSYGNDSIILVERYLKKFNIVHIDSNDTGIYDAMNKGKNLVKGDFIHYLNSGDLVHGDVYLNINTPMLLPVKISIDSIFWWDKVKLFGYAYCHQGIIFPKDHKLYDTCLKVSADFKLIVETFPQGLYGVKYNNGHVTYYLGGYSSLYSFLAKYEAAKISYHHLNFENFIKIALVLIASILIPRQLRRKFAYLLWK